MNCIMRDMNIKKKFNINIIKMIKSQSEASKKWPSSITKRINSFYTIGIALLFVGVVASLFLAQGLSSLLCLGFTFVISLIIAGYGYFIGHNIVRHGYKTVVGECISYIQSPFHIAGKDSGRVMKMIFQTNDDLIGFPIAKNNTVIPIGMNAKIFIPSNAPYFEKEGIKTYSNIYAYELIPDN